MPTLEFATDLRASLDSVWAFHQDVTRALPLLSPPGSDVRIISADLPARVGQRVQMSVKGPLGVRMKWVARIVAFVPPGESAPAGEATDPARSASFVDIQEAGPFADWKHEHLFLAMPDGGSRMVDRITYRVPLGPLGWIANRLFVARQLREMFRHRHEVTRKLT